MQANLLLAVMKARIRDLCNGVLLLELPHSPVDTSEYRLFHRIPEGPWTSVVVRFCPMQALPRQSFYKPDLGALDGHDVYGLSRARDRPTLTQSW